jgi:hypothetical protein
MERLLVECTVRALLLVGPTAATLYVTRVKDAAAKHRVWTGVMALMLFLPVWAMWGPKFSLRVLPPLPSVGAPRPIRFHPACSTACIRHCPGTQVGSWRCRARWSAYQPSVYLASDSGISPSGSDFSAELARVGKSALKLDIDARGGTFAAPRFANAMVCAIKPRSVLVSSCRVVVRADTLRFG